MSDNTRKNMLKKLLLQTQHSSRLWAALAALCVGTTLLLISVMIWWDFSELLYGKDQNDTLGSTFLVVVKAITNQNMGTANATLFSQTEIDSLKMAPEVQEIGVITSNHFPVYAKMGGNLSFATDLPLECVPDRFIDKMPEQWKWAPGDQNLPIILSSEFLRTYNYVFAPSQGLPQLSESSVKSVALILEVGSDSKEVFTGHVVGFSDRIGSVLVPKSFIDYGNQKYAKHGTADASSQLIVKAKDPSDKRFVDYLERHNYTTNSQNLLWNKIRAIVEVVASATGVLALLLMGIGTLVFVLFIELTIARAQHSLTLLLQIGHSPKFVSRFMIHRFLPMVVATVAFSMIITMIAQLVTATTVHSQGLVLTPLPGWPVWAALVVSTGILILLVSNSIGAAIRKR